MKSLCVLIVFFLMAGFVSAHNFRSALSPLDSFPVPPADKNMLFYLQRTPNINTLVYELNMNDGKLDEDEPVHVYWIRYGEKGQRAELSFIQRHYAYGLKFKNLGNRKYEIRFVSYKKLPLYLEWSEQEGRYNVYAVIQKKQSKLTRIFVQIEGGTFWFPDVKWVEIKGVDPDTKKEVKERFKP